MVQIQPDHARLARRGNTLLVLLPKVTRRKAGEGTACECDGMPRPSIPGFYALVLDDSPPEKLEELEVPLFEDFVAWECKTYAV